MGAVSIPRKKCCRCQVEKPATTDFFPADKNRSSGLHPACKDCEHVRLRAYHDKNRELVNTRARLAHAKNRDRINARQRENYHANIERHREYGRRYREKYPGRGAERARLERLQHPERTRMRTRKYKAAHRTFVKERNSLYGKTHPTVRRANWHRYMARKRKLVAAFTAQEWQFCLDHFGNSCAACEAKLPLTADHWIPLTDLQCPGTVATNIVPLCRSCNSSKGNKPAETWLVTKFGADKAHEIMVKIAGYVSHVEEISKNEKFISLKS